MQRLGSTPSGILSTFDFLFPRLGERYEALGEPRKEITHFDMCGEPDTFHYSPLSDSETNSTYG